MTNLKSIILIACSFSFIIACSDTPEEKKPENKAEKTLIAKDDGSEEFEKYIMLIDDSTKLNEGNSLYYSHSDGTSYEVTFKINDDGQILRMTEKYTVTSSGSIQSNVFYYKDNSMYASKEYFEKGTGDDAYFVERVSYYDENSEPKLTKDRTAPFEDYLDQEAFKLINNYKCSDAKAIRALSQKNEFETNFKGFVEDGQMLYLMVGENKEEGYETAILVQYRTPFIQSLFKNQKSKMGVKLEVNFETMRDVAGYEFQSLINASEVVE